MINYKVQLKEDIQDKIGVPININAVIATIESLGIREIDAITDYQSTSIEELAKTMFNEIKDKCNTFDSNLPEIENPKYFPLSDYLWVKTKLFVTKYPAGLIHQTPAFLQIFSIVLFGYSLWTSLEFNELQSTTVVLGVIIGFIVSGGFVQVIGKQISFYWNHQDYINTKSTINNLIENGLKTFLLVFIILFTMNVILNFYPFSVLIVMSCYSFLIGYLLLALAPLYPLKQRWISSVAIIIGTAISLLLKAMDVLPIYLTHWIGISLSIFISRIFIKHHLKFVKKNDLNHVSQDLKSSQIIYSNFNYFLYGVFFYLFVFLDRILAWSSNINRDLPYFIFYEPNYEIGMDLAVLTFFLMVGVLEYSITTFSKFLDYKQRSTSIESLKKFNNDFKKAYWRNVSLLIVSGIIITSALYLLITSRWGYSSLFNEQLKDIGLNVFLYGSIGYILLIWGMLNTLYLFTLNISSTPLKSIIIGFLANLIVGFVLSRFFYYEYSVFGMLTGAFAYMLLTLRKVLRFFTQLDYHYYASF